jgi:hypothetical protein
VGRHHPVSIDRRLARHLDEAGILPGLDSLLADRAQVAEGIEEPFGPADIDGDDAVADALPGAEVCVAGEQRAAIKGEMPARGKQPGEILGAQQVLVLEGDGEVRG